MSFIIFLGARGILQLARYPYLLRHTFGTVVDVRPVSAAAAAKDALLP